MSNQDKEEKILQDEESQIPEMQDENPFAEEFDKDMVINPEPSDPFEEISKSAQQERTHDENVTPLLSREDFKELGGISEDEDDIEFEDQKTQLQRLFKDFLTVPRITGDKKSALSSNIIPSELIGNGDGKIELTSENPLNAIDHSKASVLVNRDDKGDVESIEITCSCGERTLIKFDYDESDGASTEVIVDTHQEDK